MNKRWLRWLYPREFWGRYGDEITELLRRSDSPVRDHLNVLAHAGRLRSEELMIDLARHAVNLALAASLFWLGYVVSDLQGGLADIHRHWWSTAAALLVVLLIAARASIGRQARPPSRARRV